MEAQRREPELLAIGQVISSGQTVIGHASSGPQESWSDHKGGRHMRRKRTQKQREEMIGQKHQEGQAGSWEEDGFHVLTKHWWLEFSRQGTRFLIVCKTETGGDIGILMVHRSCQGLQASRWTSSSSGPSGLKG